MADSLPRTVLYVANASKIGGGNKVLMDLMLNLDARRFRPAVVAPEPGALVDWAAAQSIPCVVSNSGDWATAGRLLRRSYELTRIIRRFGASIVHAASPMAYRALGFAGTLSGAARVCHLGFPPEAGELERAFLSGPDVVIGCYTGQADENRARIKAIAPRCRVVGVPNCVDMQRFAPGEAAADIRALRNGASVVVAILGHISDVKGYPVFVEAAARIAAIRPDCRFLAIGSETTQPGCQAALETSIRAHGLGERFHFLGFRSDVADVLRAVDIVALPSLAEGFPLAVLEAMASGKALVATPVGGVGEALVNGHTGVLVSPGNVDALTAALLELMDSPQLRARLGTAARARIEERFSVTVFAQEIQSIYDDLLDTRRPRTSSAATAALPTVATD